MRGYIREGAGEGADNLVCLARGSRSASRPAASPAEEEGRAYGQRIP